MKIITLSIALTIVFVASGQDSFAQGGLEQRVAELSQQIATKMSAKQKTTIAVVEFTDLQGNVTDLGRFLAEELVTRLADLEKFRVIERQLLAKIIAEQKLSLTGVVDPTSAKQLGKILGVDAIVSGTVTNLAQNVRVNARLISTQTGEVFAVAASDIFKDESVTGLLLGGSGASATDGKQTSRQPDGTKKNPHNVTVRNFIVQLEWCRISAGGAVCSLTITNDAPGDRLIQLDGVFGPSSRMVDEFGAEYIVPVAHLGSDRSGGLQTYVRNTLVPQVPVRLRLEFNKVNPDAKKITLLRVAFKWIDSNGVDLNADFRDITITK
jgi:TolB-like protein